MAFHEVRFPDNISRGARGGPERRTQVVELASGDEERNASWANSRRRYDVAYGIRRADDLAAVVAFFEARNGRLHGFRFKDWADYKSCLPSQTITPLDQTIGTGNGVTTAFQLVKRYTSGGQTWVRTIARPVAGTVRIALGLVEQTSGWTLDAATGVVTFATAPVNGVVVRAGFQFDVPVRFDTDLLDVTLDIERLGSITSIPLIEIRQRGLTDSVPTPDPEPPVADDAAGEEVEHDGEVEPALCRPDVGDVCTPFHVRAIRREVLRHEVRRDGPGMFAVRRALQAPLLPRDQLVLAHQPCHGMPPDLMALIDEVKVHARATIGAVRQREGGADMRQIDHVLLLAAVALTVLPGEEPALADTKNTAHPADRETGLLRFDDAEGHRLPSFAKKAAAFLGISHSCFRTVFLRFGRFSSACRSTGASLGTLASRL